MTELQEALIAKARRALATAYSTLENDDTDAATNRAYYAMLYAAKAALIKARVTKNASWGSPAVPSPFRYDWSH